ncbi:hypothetical protein Tco_0320716 [Tanacetum coccineum]
MAALLAEKREKGDSGEGAVLSVQAYRSCAATVVKLLWSQSTWFERASKLSYDSPLGGGNTPRSDKDSLTLQELTALCTKLLDRVIALETDLRGFFQIGEDDRRNRSRSKVLADVAKVHTYSRRRRAVSTGSGGVSTAEIEWEDIRARVEAVEEPTQKLQTEERDKYSEVDQS